MTLASKAYLSDSTPAPPSGKQNIKWQNDGGSPAVNLSGYDPVMVGDSGSGGEAGNVPAPAAGDAAAGKFLRADGSFAVPPGLPANFADNEVVSGSGTTFTLAHTPSPAGSLILVQIIAGFGGVVLINPTNYTISGAVITISAGAGGNLPATGEVNAWYRY